ncbi:hypothetical protein D3C87_1663540 [compost metagenome]
MFWGTGEIQLNTFCCIFCSWAFKPGVFVNELAGLFFKRAGDADFKFPVFCWGTWENTNTYGVAFLPVDD